MRRLFLSLFLCVVSSCSPDPSRDSTKSIVKLLGSPKDSATWNNSYRTDHCVVTVRFPSNELEYMEAKRRFGANLSFQELAATQGVIPRSLPNGMTSEFEWTPWDTLGDLISGEHCGHVIPSTKNSSTYMAISSNKGYTYIYFDGDPLAIESYLRAGDEMGGARAEIGTRSK